MTYEEAKALILGDAGEVHLELDRLRNLLAELGNPEADGRYIHIAGTNGKGSIAAYLAGTLTEAGFRVGCYTSPVVYEYGEQYRINGEMITREAYTRLAARIGEAMERMREAHLAMPSPFERETALGLLWYKEQACDWVILECGMGGRTDATNVIPAPRLAVFASISMDHMDYLGRTVGEIAWVKAGIIKPGCVAVTALQDPRVMEVLQKECETAGVPLRVGTPGDAELVSAAFGGVQIRYKGQLLQSPLAGVCQVENMVTAYEALTVLREQGVPLTEEMIRCGMRKASWQGRFSAVCRKPLFIVDGAHNARAAQILRDSVELYFPDRRKIFIMGVFADKDYPEVISLTAPLASKIFAIATPDNARALPADQLAEAIRPVNPEVEACATVEEAVRRAFAEAGEEDVILFFGSLSNIGRITSLVSEMTGSENTNGRQTGRRNQRRKTCGTDMY